MGTRCPWILVTCMVCALLVVCTAAVQPVFPSSFTTGFAETLSREAHEGPVSEVVKGTLYYDCVHRKSRSDVPSGIFTQTTIDEWDTGLQYLQNSGEGMYWACWIVPLSGQQNCDWLPPAAQARQHATTKVNGVECNHWSWTSGAVDYYQSVATGVPVRLVNGAQGTSTDFTNFVAAVPDGSMFLVPHEVGCRPLPP